MECSAVVIAHCNLRLLGSSDPPASASWAAGTEGALHYSPRNSLILCATQFMFNSPQLWTKKKIFLQFICSNQNPNKFHTLNSVNIWLFKIFLKLLFLETGSRYVAQAGLKLLTSNDLPTLTSQSAGITGASHWAQLLFLDKYSVTNPDWVWSPYLINYLQLANVGCIWLYIMIHFWKWCNICSLK